MNTPSSLTTPLTASSDDYTYSMQVHAPVSEIVAAVTDGAAICRWWTSAEQFERIGQEVRLLRDGAAWVSFKIDHSVGSTEVSWTITACGVEDWIGTRPSFSVRSNDDGTVSVDFCHVGLRPALECFDMCQAGWNHFMPSLHQFLETGVGRPNEPRDPA